MKLTVKQSFRLGAILRKINLPLEEFKSIDIRDENGQEKLGMLLIETVVKNYAIIEDEVVDFLVHYKNISKEQAEELPFTELITIFKEIISGFGGDLSHFLASSTSPNGTTEISSSPDTTLTT